MTSNVDDDIKCLPRVPGDEMGASRGSIDDDIEGRAAMATKWLLVRHVDRVRLRTFDSAANESRACFFERFSRLRPNPLVTTMQSLSSSLRCVLVRMMKDPNPRGLFTNRLFSCCSSSIQPQWQVQDWKQTHRQQEQQERRGLPAARQLLPPRRPRPRTGAAVRARDAGDRATRTGRVRAP